MYFLLYYVVTILCEIRFSLWLKIIYEYDLSKANFILIYNIGIDVNRRLLGGKAYATYASAWINYKIVKTPVVGIFNLIRLFQLIVYRFN